MTEGDAPSIEIFGRQGILGGVKVPVLWGLQSGVAKNLNLNADVDVGTPGRATFGIKLAERYVQRVPWFTDSNCQRMSKYGIFSLSLTPPSQYSLQDIEAMPWATRYMKCGGDVNEICKNNKYIGHCWNESRTDVIPPTKQAGAPGGRAGEILHNDFLPMHDFLCGCRALLTYLSCLQITLMLTFPVRSMFR